MLSVYVFQSLIIFLLACYANSFSCSGSHETAEIVNLLTRQGYDEHLLPDLNGVAVFVELHIQDISSVSAARSDFELEVFFSEIWLDSRLKYRSNCRHNVTIKSEQIEEQLWTPNICITNSKQNSFVHQSPIENQFLIIYPNGKIWRNHRMKIKAPCRLNIAKFPFDFMICKLLFESYSFNSAEVKLQWLPHEPVTYMGTVDLPEFSLMNISYKKLQVEYPNGLWDELELTFLFERRYGYYIMRNFVPTSLTVVVSWITFFLEERSNSARITIGVSSLMALSFQLGVSSDDLPKASQMKGLDVWMLICIIYVFLSLVEFAVISRIARFQRRQNLKQLTVSALWSLLGKFKYDNSESSKNKKRQKMGQLHIGSNEIDAISAVLFPTTFFALATAFWVYYVIDWN